MGEKGKPHDGRWSRYPETVLVFAGDPAVSVDLREMVPAPVQKGLRALGLDGPFAVITAFNPRGEDIGDEENSRRAAALESELQSSGDTFLRVDACAPDRSHCECSVALRGTRQRALAMARRWEQISIFWWDGTRFWIFGAISDAEPMALPVDTGA